MEKGRSAARVQRVQKVVLAAGAAGWGRLRRRVVYNGATAQQEQTSGIKQ